MWSYDRTILIIEELKRQKAPFSDDLSSYLDLDTST
jgi:hypothetical protein